MIAGVVTSIIECFGDYYTCARLAGVLPPPPTEVGSQRVVLVAVFFMALFVCLRNFTFIIATLPDPVTGGSFIVLFAVLTAVGASYLQFVNISSSRNLAVFGLALFLGLRFPTCVVASETLVKTGSEDFDQILKALLANNMFVGSFTALFLENVLPGTPEERRISVWAEIPKTSYETDEVDDETVGGLSLKSYDFPFRMSYIRRWSWPKYVPFIPGFQGFACRTRFYKKKEIDGKSDNVAWLDSLAGNMTQL